MKKIIIVNNNMKVGGVQKSLSNLLWSIDGKYDVTLLLFRAVGTYLEDLPPSIKVIECSSLFRYLGVSQGDCKNSPADYLKRGILAAFCRVFGREAVMCLLLLSQRMLPDHYDCAISFLHNGRRKSFYGGTQEFVLKRIRADKKAAFLHCDYSGCGADYPGNHRLLRNFDVIAACSDGCRRIFLECLPEMGKKCVVVRNCHRVRQIRNLAEQSPAFYDPQKLHVIMVSRLTHEKGIERAVSAVAKAAEGGLPVMLHIVGGGSMEEKLRQQAAELGIADRVCFYGEQSNPYRFMKNADLFLMTSYHEAAPMVIEEARCLGLPVLTVETTSSREMVTQEEGGWVCANSQEALTHLLKQILKHPNDIAVIRRALHERTMDNDRAMAQFVALIEGDYED